MVAPEEQIRELPQLAPEEIRHLVGVICVMVALLLMAV